MKHNENTSKAIEKSVNQLKDFCETVIGKNFAKYCDDQDDYESAIAATLLVVVTLMKNDVFSPKWNKDDVDDEAEKPATEAAKPAAGKRQKCGEGEDEIDFLKRAAIELGTELLNGLGEFGLKQYQATSIALSIAGALVDSFDLEEEMFKMLLGKLAK